MTKNKWTYEELKEYQRTGIAPDSAQRTAMNENFCKQRKSAKTEAAGKIKLILLNLNADFETEFKFHPNRKWRFDFALTDRKIAIEYEGVFNGKSRHTNVIGFTNDCEKYNEAVLNGWRVLRFTAIHLENGIAYRQICRVLEAI